MKQRMVWQGLVLVALVSLGAACGEPETDPVGTEPEGEVIAIEEIPLTDPALLKMGAPSNEELPSEGKADEVLPEKFDLIDVQSPVRSQARRGVCSIFSTVGLMESLYIIEGTHTNPDFSEQYLQWSAKFEVGSFPNTSGSNASSNLQAIQRFGIVEEVVWPYEGSEWGASDDPACGEENKPTRCYTNGEPTEEISAAKKWHLPENRFISTRPRDIKSFMKRTGQPVVVGGDFYYQAWNHGSSNLPTSNDYKAKGYVMYPNQEDIEDSSGDRRAGHSILLVGWDDTLEVQRRTADGEPMVDPNGNPVMEKGFYLFKNSWGTGAFGTENPFGDGYGWLSQRYVEEFLRGRVSDVPELEPEIEICNDMLDNDGNGDIDCGDAACAAESFCQPGTDELTVGRASMEPLSIPDNDDEGVTDIIQVEDDREIKAVVVDVFVEHSFAGDVNVVMTHPDGTVVIVQGATGNPGDNLELSVPATELIGKSAAGEWKLHVWDEAALDTGALVNWTLTFTF